jgi:hypothetical protein
MQFALVASTTGSSQTTLWRTTRGETVQTRMPKVQARRSQGGPSAIEWTADRKNDAYATGVLPRLCRLLWPNHGSADSQHYSNLQLSALFAEVERFVDPRPITYVTSDPKDIEALTPYHFWLNRRSPVIPLGDYSWPNFQDRFRQTQHLANLVWQQWVKLYLMTLLTRKK